MFQDHGVVCVVVLCCFSLAEAGRGLDAPASHHHQALYIYPGLLFTGLQIVTHLQQLKLAPIPVIFLVKISTVGWLVSSCV